MAAPTAESLYGSAFREERPRTRVELMQTRLDRGRKLNAHVSDVLKKRAEAEKQYAEALKKIASDANGVITADEAATFAPVWAEISKDLTTTAKAHETLATSLKQHAKDAVEFEKEPRWAGVSHLDKKFEEHLKEVEEREAKHEKVQETFRLAASQVGSAKKDNNKDTLKKANTKYEAAEAKMQSSFQKMRKLNQKWEKDAVEIFHSYEVMDQDRLNRLKVALFTASNVESETLTSEISSTLKLVETIKHFDVAADLAHFAKSKDAATYFNDGRAVKKSTANSIPAEIANSSAATSNVDDVSSDEEDDQSKPSPAAQHEQNGAVVPDPVVVAPTEAPKVVEEATATKQKRGSVDASAAKVDSAATKRKSSKEDKATEKAEKAAEKAKVSADKEKDKKDKKEKDKEKAEKDIKDLIDAPLEEPTPAEEKSATLTRSKSTKEESGASSLNRAVSTKSAKDDDEDEDDQTGKKKKEKKSVFGTLLGRKKSTKVDAAHAVHDEQPAQQAQQPVGDDKEAAKETPAVQRDAEGYIIRNNEDNYKNPFQKSKKKDSDDSDSDSDGEDKAASNKPKFQIRIKTAEEIAAAKQEGAQEVDFKNILKDNDAFALKAAKRRSVRFGGDEADDEQQQKEQQQPTIDTAGASFGGFANFASFDVPSSSSNDGFSAAQTPVVTSFATSFSDAPAFAPVAAFATTFDDAFGGPAKVDDAPEEAAVERTVDGKVTLETKIVETVSAYFDGGELQKFMVTGELLVVKPQGGLDELKGLVPIRLFSEELLDKVAPNAALIAPIEGTVDEFNLNGDALATHFASADRLPIFKYQFSSGPGNEAADLLVPLLVNIVWKIQDNLMSLHIGYERNVDSPLAPFALTGVSFLVSVEGEVLKTVSKPAGVWSKEKGKMLWKVGDLPAVEEEGAEVTGRIMARFEVNGPSAPQSVAIRFQCDEMNLLDVDVAEIDVNHTVAVTSATRSLVSGKYIAAHSADADDTAAQQE